MLRLQYFAFFTEKIRGSVTLRDLNNYNGEYSCWYRKQTKDTHNIV